jgi:predicted alpha/beta hydrolase family esterase
MAAFPDWECAMDPRLTAGPARLLIIPGLGNSGPGHWQSWLESLDRSALRVRQRDWLAPELDTWAARIGEVLEQGGAGPWLAVAHSYGCLALARYLHLQGRTSAAPRVAAALLVAPADPERFGVVGLLPARPLALPTTMVISDTDPWMGPATARHLAACWGSHCINLGAAGHINVEAGFGPLPLARRWLIKAGQRVERGRRPQRERAFEDPCLARFGIG